MWYSLVKHCECSAVLEDTFQRCHCRSRLVDFSLDALHRYKYIIYLQEADDHPLTL